MAKSILFVCVENSCRSQMAEAFARNYGADIQVYSAGSRPSGVVNKDAILVMQEIGIDMSYYKSKGFTDLPFKEFDYVITLGCKDTCPFIPADKHIEWDIADPKGQGVDFFRRTRDQIKNKVEELLEDIMREEANGQAF